jgi:hypothetical protein
LGEVALRKVESIIRDVTLAADERVKRKPVCRTQVGQRLARLRRITIPGRNHAAPSGRREKTCGAIVRL